MSPFGAKHPISETQWRRGGAAAFLVLVVVFGVLLERAEDQTDRVEKQVTKVESPCLKYGPKSEECERAFDAAVSTITHPQACAIERKAGTLRAIRELADGLGVDFTEPCAGARIAQERQRGNEREATSQRLSQENSGSGGGGVPASTGGPPAPSTGAGDGGGRDDGAEPKPPRNPQPSPAPPPGSTSGPPPPAPVAPPPPAAVLNPAGKEVPAQPPGLLPKALEGIRGTVNRVEDEVLAPALCLVRGLLKPCS